MTRREAPGENARPDLVRDLGSHLGDELITVLKRHVISAQSGGATIIEAAAIAMVAAEILTSTAIGVAMLGGDPAKRVEMFEATIAKLADHLAGARAAIIRGVEKAAEQAEVRQ